MKRTLAVVLVVGGALVVFVAIVLLATALLTHKRPVELLSRLILGAHVDVHGTRFRVPSPCRVHETASVDRGAFVSCVVGVQRQPGDKLRAGLTTIVFIGPEDRPIELSLIHI